MNNEPKVIEFPKSKVVRDIPQEHLVARQAKADLKLADSIVDEITGMMLTELDNYYIEVADKTFNKDLVLVVDALKSAVYRSFGIEHHLQDFVDKNVKVLEGIDADTSKEEIQEKIDAVIKELQSAKERLDTDEPE
jgi:vacuolar-type H+-ATPase subunit E/Vma4